MAPVESPVDVALAVGPGMGVLDAPVGAGPAVFTGGMGAGAEALPDGLPPGVGAPFDGVPSGAELWPDGPGSGCESVGTVANSLELVSSPSLQLADKMQVNVASKARVVDGCLGSMVSWIRAKGYSPERITAARGA